MSKKSSRSWKWSGPGATTNSITSSFPLKKISVPSKDNYLHTANPGRQPRTKLKQIFKRKFLSSKEKSDKMRKHLLNCWLQQGETSKPGWLEWGRRSVPLGEPGMKQQVD